MVLVCPVLQRLAHLLARVRRSPGTADRSRHLEVVSGGGTALLGLALGAAAAGAFHPLPVDAAETLVVRQRFFLRGLSQLALQLTAGDLVPQRRGIALG